MCHVPVHIPCCEACVKIFPDFATKMLHLTMKDATEDSEARGNKSVLPITLSLYLRKVMPATVE